MMTDDDTPPIEGEIVGPEGDGQWLSVPDASRVTSIPQKTLYRRVERNRIPSRKNADGRIEVWVSAPGPLPGSDTRLSPIVGINTVEVRELLGPLAQALADSQRRSEENLERALRAEAEIERLKERLSRSRRVRQSDTGWWTRWLWWRKSSSDDETSKDRSDL